MRRPAAEANEQLAKEGLPQLTAMPAYLSRR